MKFHFNKFERIAGLFVVGALVGCLAMGVFIAVKKGWFASKLHFETLVTSAEGLHEGTVVQVAGIRAGSVTDIELISAEKVRIQFYVYEKFQNQIRRDSTTQVVRPFIIGEKVIEVSIGSSEESLLSGNDFIASKPSFDVMDLLSGRKMGNALATIEKLADNLKILGEAFSDPKRTQALVKVFDRLEPLVDNLNSMSHEFAKVGRSVNKGQRIESIVGSLAKASVELEKLLPGFSEEVPDLGKQLGQIVNNLNVLTTEFQKLTPAITAIAPELPRTSLRAVEALDETVVLLKAMQQSFMLRGNVEKVRKAEESRQPAGEK